MSEARRQRGPRRPGADAEKMADQPSADVMLNDQPVRSLAHKDITIENVTIQNCRDTGVTVSGRSGNPDVPGEDFRVQNLRIRQCGEGIVCARARACYILFPNIDGMSNQDAVEPVALKQFVAIGAITRDNLGSAIDAFAGNERGVIALNVSTDTPTGIKIGGGNRNSSGLVVVANVMHDVGREGIYTERTVDAHGNEFKQRALIVSSNIVQQWNTNGDEGVFAVAFNDLDELVNVADNLVD